MSKHQFLSENSTDKTPVVQARVDPNVYAFLRGYSKAYRTSMSSAVNAMLVTVINKMAPEDVKIITSGKKLDQKQKVTPSMPPAQNLMDRVSRPGVKGKV